MARLISLRRSLPYGGRTYNEGDPFEAIDDHARLLVAAGIARQETTLEFNNRQMCAGLQPDGKPARRARRNREDADAQYDRRDLALTRKSDAMEQG